MFDARGPRGEVRIAYRTIAEFGAWALEHGAVVQAADVPMLDEVSAEMPGRRSLRLRLGATWWIWDDVQVDSYRPLVARVSGSRRLVAAEE